MSYEMLSCGKGFHKGSEDQGVVFLLPFKTLSSKKESSLANDPTVVTQTYPMNGVIEPAVT